MTSPRSLRITTFRTCANIFHGEINCITATCFLVLVFLLITVTVNLTRTPTVLTSLENFHIDLKELEKETENTILIEQEDGSVYIAFRMKKSAKVLNDIKQGKVVINTVHRSDLKEKTTASSLREAQNGTKVTSNSSSDVRMKQNESDDKSSRAQIDEPKPTYPLSILNDPYSINNPDLCKVKSDISFLVIVHTATTHFMRRSSIRETWANYKLFKSLTMRIIFLLGQPEKATTQTLIEHESYVNKDIIQGKFLDSYKNLTHKGVLGLRWTAEYCPQAKIIVKVDDDVFLNVFKLIEQIETNFKNKTREIWCPVRYNNTSLIQRKSGKWKVDDNEFKNLTHFPVTYCNGFFTILTSDIIPEMFEATKVTPFFWIDDVYLFGLLPAKIGGVKHSPLPNLNLNEKHAIECFESKNKTCELLVANAHSDGIMDKFWFSAIQQYKTLAHKYSKDELFS